MPRISHWLRQHPRFIRYTLLSVLGVALLSVLLQLMYPAGRVLPGVKVAGKTVGSLSTIDASKRFEKEYANAALVVKTGEKSFTKSFDEIGIYINGMDTARAAARYSVGQRLIPFSSIYVMLNRDTPMKVDYDDERLRYFAQQVQKEAYVPAVDASVTVKHDRVELVPAQKSKEYPERLVVEGIKKTNIKPKTTISISPKSKPADRTDEEVQGVLKQAQQAVDTPLSLQVDAEKITVDKMTIGSWLDFQEDPATNKLQLGLNVDTVKKYLERIQSKVYKAPGTTTIQLLDGREVGRREGAPGRGIDTEKTIAALGTAIKDNVDTTVTVPVATIPAKVVYERQYSNTDAGLAALLDDLTKGKDIGISVMEIGGRSASSNGSKSYVAASTYKLFVAYAVFKQIEAGQMSWGDDVNGKTVDTCFDIMIVKSDNPCAKTLGERIGWQKIEDMMKGLGLTATELTPSFRTTANDLSRFNQKLVSGSLLNGEQTAKLLDAMKRQVYRAGIPAGTGVAVADKVGFIDSYIHDAAIVYGPKRTYALTIMTSGSSWAGIADIARQIHAFLNR